MAKDIYKVRQLGQGTYSIEENYFGSSCILYLVEGDSRALLVDTGMGAGKLAELVGTLTQKPVWVVNTHGHFDHIGANWQFEDIYIHEAEKAVLALHQSKEFLKQKSRQMLPLLARVLLRPQLARLLTPKTGGRYHFVPDGYVFDLGGRRLELIHTPGHSTGSACLLDAETRMLFSGDTVCDTGILLDLEGSEPPQTYLQSVLRIQGVAGAFDGICPGHRQHPLDKSYLDDYVACARQIVDGSFSHTPHGSNFNGAAFGKIAIALPPQGEDAP